MSDPHIQPEQLPPACVFILAGGSGERFWPMSRTKTPKHLLRLLSDKTLLETTVRRLEGIIPWDRVYILTSNEQAEAVRSELPFLPAKNIIAEPAKRDTAPACALATAITAQCDPEAVCVLLPADAMIHKVQVFQKQLAQAITLASHSEALFTFAVPPTAPATAFGYLQLGEGAEGEACKVIRFVEKPDKPTAESYLQTGRHFWNAGMFVWKAKSFLREAERLAPQLGHFIAQFPPSDTASYIAEKFPVLPKISVDYAIMEKAGEVRAIKAEFDWDDVGSWTAIPEHLGHDEDGNTFRGNVVHTQSQNNVAVSNKRLIALCGVENLVIVETEDAILICHRDAAQDIKKLHALLPESVK